MRIPVVLLLLVVLIGFSVLPALAVWPDYSPSEISTRPGAFVMTPSGNAPSLESQNVGIQVWLRELTHGALENYPAEDIWMEPVTGDLAWCSGGNHADANTAAGGYTTFHRALQGGGWSQAGVMILASGDMIPITPHSNDYVLDLRINSPDNNGDLVVDLSDISVFGQDLTSYHFRSDFDHNGTVDLQDISLFSGWVGDRCP